MVNSKLLLWRTGIYGLRSWGVNRKGFVNARRFQPMSYLSASSNIQMCSCIIGCVDNNTGITSRSFDLSPGPMHGWRNPKTLPTSRQNNLLVRYMAGHSQWSNRKHQKGRADEVRGKRFAKLLTNISTAAKLGPDPDSNPRLASAISVAKKERVPKDRIEKALEVRSLGSTTIFAASIPGGVTIIIETSIEPKQRNGTEASTLKKMLTKQHGATFKPFEQISWQFERKFVATIDKDVLGDLDPDEVALEVGAEDTRDLGDCVLLICELDAEYTVRDELEGGDLDYEGETTFVANGATTAVTLNEYEVIDEVLASVREYDCVLSASCNAIIGTA
eukprot:m.174158 g.174158  ORF g.174158 m.174158 type:complete len:333 (+) comp31755_c0_seq2:153-1151(+)